MQLLFLQFPVGMLPQQFLHQMFTLRANFRILLPKAVSSTMTSSPCVSFVSCLTHAVIPLLLRIISHTPCYNTLVSKVWHFSWPYIKLDLARGFSSQDLKNGNHACLAWSRHSTPTGFCPIALTSCICKLEKMLNVCLVYFLEHGDQLALAQCGFHYSHSICPFLTGGHCL